MRLLLALLLGACAPSGDKGQDAGDDTGLPTEEDADGDGSPAAEDCDDGDAAIHPGADEVCDGLDQDCDGQTDEEVTDGPVWYLDEDADGTGRSGSTASSCAQPAGYVAEGTDCADWDAAIHPADEVCNETDDDCDGETDEEAIDAPEWYADTDGDGHGAAPLGAACSAPEGAVAEGDDCDDADPTIHPGAAELCDEQDQDCDGDLDAETCLSGALWIGQDWDDPERGTHVNICTTPYLGGPLVEAAPCEDCSATWTLTWTLSGADECDLFEEQTWTVEQSLDGGTLRLRAPSGDEAETTDLLDGTWTLYADFYDGTAFSWWWSAELRTTTVP